MALSGVVASDALVGALSNGATDALGISVLKKATDIQQTAITGLLQALPQPSNPATGKTLDVRL